MKYKITPEQVKLMMDDILKRKNIKVDIMYWTHSLHTNSIQATVYLYKDGQVFGGRHGYEFTFKYDKRFDSLVYSSRYPHIEKLDFFKMIPEEVVIKYFADKTEEYLRGYLDRGNVPAFKRLVSEELETTKSDFERKSDVFRKILNLKSYEGVCSYKFGRDHDDENKIGSVIVEFSHDWYRSSDKPNDLQRKLASISATKMDIKNIGKKFLGIENFYVGSYLVHCESSLNEETKPKDVAFLNILRKVIPDGSVYEYTYELPYADEGNVNVIMKYSVLPTSRIMKMIREDGSEYDGLQLHLMIDELIWKSDFDKDWETIKRPHDLPTRFWSEFEDDMSDLFRKRLGIKYVETYFKHPDISHI